MSCHFVRYGLLGHVGCFASADASLYARQSRVIVRSPRGLEKGVVLGAVEGEAATAALDGRILRRMTVQDDLLDARLERRRQEACVECERLLASAGIQSALVDVEHLFDGQGLFFYFLGDPPDEAGDITRRLAEAYEAAVEFRKFADTLADGCGPGCGTEEAKGQGGCAACLGCAAAGACGAPR